MASQDRSGVPRMTVVGMLFCTALVSVLMTLMTTSDVLVRMAPTAPQRPATVPAREERLRGAVRPGETLSAPRAAGALPGARPGSDAGPDPDDPDARGVLPEEGSGGEAEPPEVGAPEAPAASAPPPGGRSAQVGGAGAPPSTQEGGFSPRPWLTERDAVALDDFHARGLLVNYELDKSAENSCDERRNLNRWSVMDSSYHEYLICDGASSIRCLSRKPRASARTCYAQNVYVDVHSREHPFTVFCDPVASRWDGSPSADVWSSYGKHYDFVKQGYVRVRPSAEAPAQAPAAEDRRFTVLLAGDCNAWKGGPRGNPAHCSGDWSNVGEILHHAERFGYHTRGDGAVVALGWGFSMADAAGRHSYLDIYEGWARDGSGSDAGGLAAGGFGAVELQLKNRPDDPAAFRRGIQALYGPLLGAAAAPGAGPAHGVLLRSLSLGMNPWMGATWPQSGKSCAKRGVIPKLARMRDQVTGHLDGLASAISFEDAVAGATKVHLGASGAADPANGVLVLMRDAGLEGACKRCIHNRGALIDAIIEANPERTVVGIKFTRETGFLRQYWLFRSFGVVLGMHGGSFGHNCFMSPGQAMIEVQAGKFTATGSAFEHTAVGLGVTYRRVGCPDCTWDDGGAVPIADVVAAVREVDMRRLGDARTLAAEVEKRAAPA